MNQLFRKFASILGSLLLTLLVACPPSTAPGDISPPTVLGTSAKNNTSVVVIFSEAVVGGNVSSNFNISNLNISAANVATDGKTVTLTTSSQTLQTYALTVSTIITDLAGNAYNSKYDLPIAKSFIGKPLDTVPPTVVSTTPKTKTTVEVVFSEQIVGGNVASNFSFPSQGLSVSVASVAADNKTVTLTTSSQTTNSPYSLLVNSSVTDLAGNAYDLASQNTNATGFIGL
jgi:trimeric autotransporter adhesin